MANEKILTYLGSIIPYIPETTRALLSLLNWCSPDFCPMNGTAVGGCGLGTSGKGIHRINISKPSPYHSFGGGLNPSEIY